jgi:hypothetical protein
MAAESDGLPLGKMVAKLVRLAKAQSQVVKIDTLPHPPDAEAVPLVEVTK